MILGAGCERTGGTSATTEPSTRPALTVASLSPAATDMILGMEAGEHLVAVSKYDLGKPGLRDLPVAGDYESIDWERLGRLRPSVMVMQVAKSRVPAGVQQRADQLGIKIQNIGIDKLEDIPVALREIGSAIGESAKAAAGEAALQRKLEEVRKRVAGSPAVPTLIVTDDSGMAVAGRDNFLDQVLTLAGGSNVAAPAGAGYFSIDREKIAALQPQVVLQLLGDASPPAVEQVRRFWNSMPELPAVKQGRVYYLTESSILMPGLKVGETAEVFASKLHPPDSRPSSAPIQQGNL